MPDKDINLLKRLLKKQGRKDLANLLTNSYSKLDESSTYGSRLYSVLTNFEIYSPTDEYLKLSALSDNDKEIILHNIKIIYPLKNDAPEIVGVEFFVDPKIEIYIEDEAVKLKRPEIFRVVNDYIGVKDGYLGTFSYNTHAEFYPYYCDLDIDPNQYSGTTRERFITILESSDILIQAKILRGVLKKFPIEDMSVEDRDKKEIVYKDIQNYILRLEENKTTNTLNSPNLLITNETVERAILDAKTLINENGATSGVDRIHTVLHGYLKQVCIDAEIEFKDDSSLTEIYKILRSKHPKLSEKGSRQEEIDKILRAIATIMDVLNPIRNKASIAHPNEILLEEDEAKLVINTAQTILHYLNSKFKE